MKASSGLKGTKELARAIRQLGPDFLTSAGGSLFRSSEKVMAISRDIYCPLDTGALRSTGHVQLPIYTKDSVTVPMGYGGPAAPYAVYVHEIDKNYHDGKTWKYLQTPLEQNLGEINTALVTDLKSDARSGAKASRHLNPENLD